MFALCNIPSCPYSCSLFGAPGTGDGLFVVLADEIGLFWAMGFPVTGELLPSRQWGCKRANLFTQMHLIMCILNSYEWRIQHKARHNAEWTGVGNQLQAWFKPGCLNFMRNRGESEHSMLHEVHAAMVVILSLSIFQCGLYPGNVFVEEDVQT